MTRMYVNVLLILSVDMDLSLVEQEFLEVNNRVG